MKWTEIPASVVLAAADICDGHTIFDPKAFLDVGVPQELVDRCTNIYESDFSNPKYTISGPDGKPVNHMRGVYGLDMLNSMVRDFDILTEPKFGRGSQAQVWKEALHKHLETKMSDNDDEEIINFAGLAEISAGAMRVFVLEDSKSSIDLAKPWVRMRCRESAQMLDFCASRIAALEQFVDKLTKVKAITDAPEFGVLLDELMTSMEEESAKYRAEENDNDN
jgi:hypothetical protein